MSINQKQAYEEGREQGYSAGRLCEVTPQDQREANCECLHRPAPDAVCTDCLTHAAFESEENARQFSPWEFLAHDINELPEGRSEATWEAYDRGVAVGIRRAVRERMKGRGPSPLPARTMPTAAEEAGIEEAVAREEARIEEGQARWSETGSTRKR